MRRIRVSKPCSPLPNLCARVDSLAPRYPVGDPPQAEVWQGLGSVSVRDNRSGARDARQPELTLHLPFAR